VVRHSSALLAVVLVACCKGGGNGGVDGPPPVQPVKILMKLGRELQQSVNERRDMHAVYEAAEICMTLYTIGAPSMYSALPAPDRYALDPVKTYFEDESGRKLLDTAAHKFNLVFQQSPELKIGALSMMIRILDEKAEQAPLRSLSAGDPSEFRSAVMNAAYRHASAGLAHKLEVLSGRPGRSASRAAIYCDALLRVSEYPSIKEEFREFFRKMNQDARAKPEDFIPLRVDAGVKGTIAEAVGFQDSAVREMATGGSSLVAVRNYLTSIAMFALGAEFAEAAQRTEYTDELNRVPNILEEIEKLVLKGK
jgi:hypothetical protein